MKKRVVLGFIICIMCALVGCGAVNAEELPKDTTSQDEGMGNDDTEKESESQKDEVELSIESLSKMKETSKDEFVYFSYEGVAYITEFIGDSECVIIPNEIDGNPVVEISNTAFRNNTNVKAVKIGENVKRIGDYVFTNCSSLQFVVFGNSVESVGDGVFVGCASMKEFKLNEGLISVGELAICGAEVPTIIPRSVTEIGLNGFKQPVKVYKGSYAETYIVDYANNYGAEFVYEIIE